jgi:hypothetical protein
VLKFLVAHTFERDDPDLAANEILEQLDTEHSLLENSAGFLFCSPDFIVSGAAEAVSRALPFEVIGCTTHGIAVPGAMSESMLAVSVLTSDDSFFKTGVSEPFETGMGDQITELYRRLSESPPVLMFVYYSDSGVVSGDEVVEVLDQVSGGTPLFGANALDGDGTVGHRIPLVIHNGAVYSDRLALLLVCGGTVESRFHVKLLPTMPVYSQPVFATASQGTNLISINGVPAAEFMEKAGIVAREGGNSFFGFPLLIDNHDGLGPKCCAVYSIEENGALRCGSTVVKGATLKLVDQMQEQILYSSEWFAKATEKEDGKGGHLIFSCFGRSVPLVDLKDEMMLFQRHIKERPYMFVYSKGEFCPVYDERGGIHNCFHQFSLISASF